MKRLLFLVFLITSFSYGQRKIAEKVNGTIIPIGYTEFSEDTTPVAGGSLDMSAFDIANANKIGSDTLNVNGPLVELRALNARGSGSFARVYLEGSDASSNPGMEASIADNSKGIIRLTRTGTDGTKWQFYNEADGGALTAKWEMIADDFVALTNGDITGVTDITASGTITANDFAGDGQAITFDASGFIGNLTTSDDTVQELAVAVNGLSTGGTDDQTAAEVPFTPAGTIAATNVQDAIEEVASEAGSGPTDTVIVTDSTWTLLNSDKGKKHEFWADVESIDVDLPASPDADAEWHLGQMTNAKVHVNDSVRFGPNVATYRTSGGGKFATVYSIVSDTTRLRIAGGIELYEASTLGPELLNDWDFELNNGNSDWTVLNDDANRIATFSGGTLRMQQTVTATPSLLIRQTPSPALVSGNIATITVIITETNEANSIKFNCFVDNWTVPNSVGTHTYTGELDDTKIEASTANNITDVTVASISLKYVQ